MKIHGGRFLFVDRRLSFRLEGIRPLRRMTCKGSTGEEYLVDLNATQAAIRAGYSVESAGSIGSENLTKPEIRGHN